MEIFYNSASPGYEEIVSYGPKWWTEYREMNAVYMFEGWLLDILAKKMEQEVKNLFPSQADYLSLVKYEKMLHIEADPDMDFEERRRIVQAYYSGSGKLSKSFIQSAVKMYGDCECELWWSDNSTLQIRIFCNDEQIFSNRQIYQLIERRFPAHLSFTIRDILCRFETKENIYFSRERHRLRTQWWDGCLDGSCELNGEKFFDAEIPTKFKAIHRIRAETKEQVSVDLLYFNFKCDEMTKIFPVVKNLITLNWWDELKTLDGSRRLDGLELLNQDTPPFWNTQKYRTDISNEENVTVSLYIPGKSKELDGSCMLDGTIRLDYGKEEL